MTRITQAALILTAGLSFAAPALAESQVYKPLLPGLGGNPDLYPYLQGLADIQNQFEEEGGSGDFPTFDFPDIDIDLGNDDTQNPPPTTTP